MKFKFIFPVLVLILSLTACRDSQDLSIKVVDDDAAYKYSASFPRNKSRAVERFINSKIAPSSINYDDYMDVTTTLDDQTKFEYEAGPGQLRIVLNKGENSKASYVRIKKMCEGLSQVINPKK